MMKNIILGVGSGKGGTGKTAVAVNLASVLRSQIQLLDCDVEEPNAGLFFNLEETSRDTVSRQIPAVDPDICTSCGLCCRFCRFGALVMLSGSPRLYADLCHSCGGCTAVCPVQAIQEVPHEVGMCISASAGVIEMVTGELRIGERSAVPLIAEVKKHRKTDMPVIIDMPPGTSCSFAEAASGCNHVLLVGEASPFGLHDLACAVDALDIMGIEYSVMVNRSTGSDIIDRFCSEKGIQIHAHLKEDIRISRCIAEGKIITEEIKEYRGIFMHLWESVTRSLS